MPKFRSRALLKDGFSSVSEESNTESITINLGLREIQVPPTNENSSGATPQSRKSKKNELPWLCFPSLGDAAGSQGSSKHDCKPQISNEQVVKQYISNTATDLLKQNCMLRKVVNEIALVLNLNPETEELIEEAKGEAAQGGE